MKSGFSIFVEQLRIPFYAIIGIAATIGFFHLVSLVQWPKDFKSKSGSGSSGSFHPIDWTLLSEMDFRSGVASENLRSLDGKPIQIPGFIVPLEDSESMVSEFLLVPSPQACIHVPPPPPNQMVYVKMKNPIKFQWSYRAIWASGILNLHSVQSPYGSVSFEMAGDSVRPFEGYSSGMDH